MTQTPSPRAQSRKKARKRPRRQQGISPFVTMGAIAVIVVVGLIAYSALQNPAAPQATSNGLAGTPPANQPTTLHVRGAAEAKVLVEEWSDFQ
jgi:hypothetical protein